MDWTVTNRTAFLTRSLFNDYITKDGWRVYMNEILLLNADPCFRRFVLDCNLVVFVIYYISMEQISS